MPVLNRIALGIPLLVLVACSSNKGNSDEPEESAPMSCESTEDCDDNMVCLAGECASTRSTDIYTDPANAVTPQKVKAEIEAIQNTQQKRRDELLEGL